MASSSEAERLTVNQDVAGSIPALPEFFARSTVATICYSVNVFWMYNPSASFAFLAQSGRAQP